MAVRQTAVAGAFYPASAAALAGELERCFGERPAGARSPKQAAIAAVLPHAGYVYSGRVAAAVCARIEVPERVVVLCPNHTGIGPALSVWPSGHWVSPVGDIPVDEALVSALCAECPCLVADQSAHVREHAIEVVLPFLYRCQPKLRVVAIVVGTHDFDTLAGLGDALARVVVQSSEPVLLVASSDMNHFEDHETTLRKDELALEPLRRLDAEGLLKVCRDMRVSMCGVGPVAAVVVAARALGAQEAKVVEHCTSAPVSGDRDRCVGYAGAVLH